MKIGIEHLVFQCEKSLAKFMINYRRNEGKTRNLKSKVQFWRNFLCNSLLCSYREKPSTSIKEKKKSLFDWDQYMKTNIHTNWNNRNQCGQEKSLLARQSSCPEEPSSENFWNVLQLLQTSRTLLTFSTITEKVSLST